jgi:hypothetical protein
VGALPLTTTSSTTQDSADALQEVVTLIRKEETAGRSETVSVVTASFPVNTPPALAVEVVKVLFA